MCPLRQMFIEHLTIKAFVDVSHRFPSCMLGYPLFCFRYDLTFFLHGVLLFVCPCCCISGIGLMIPSRRHHTCWAPTHIRIPDGTRYLILRRGIFQTRKLVQKTTENHLGQQWMKYQDGVCSVSVFDLGGSKVSYLVLFAPFSVV